MELIGFMLEHKIYGILSIILNGCLSFSIVRQLIVFINRDIAEARRLRNKELTIKELVVVRRKLIDTYKRLVENKGFYTRAVIKVKRAGFNGENAPLIYITLKIVVPAMLYIYASIINHNTNAIIPCIAIVALVELMVIRRIKDIELKFKNSAYKIYQFLYNQINAGVKPYVAIKKLPDVVDEGLREIFIAFVGRYEANGYDIDDATKVIKERVGLQEAKVLASAISQSIKTGANPEELLMQREKMFEQYFAYIKAQTAKAKAKAVVAVILFTIIFIMMFALAFRNDAQDAVKTIFIN